jgi:hypothetical protein
MSGLCGLSLLIIALLGLALNRCDLQVKRSFLEPPLTFL